MNNSEAFIYLKMVCRATDHSYEEALQDLRREAEDHPRVPLLILIELRVNQIWKAHRDQSA